MHLAYQSAVLKVMQTVLLMEIDLEQLMEILKAMSLDCLSAVKMVI